MPKLKTPDHGLQVSLDSGGPPRSPMWPGVQKKHLQEQPTCVCCGKGKAQVALQVHHIFPFHYCVELGRRDLELDDRNLITLCETEKKESDNDHHLLVGHLDDFESSNLSVVQDAKTTFHGMTAAQIRASPVWQKKKANKLTHLPEMTPEQKAAFTTQMNKAYPDVKVPVPGGPPVGPYRGTPTGSPRTGTKARKPAVAAKRPRAQKPPQAKAAGRKSPSKRGRG